MGHYLPFDHIYFVKDFLIQTIFRVIIMFLFMFWYFGHGAGGILVLQPGIKPTPLPWKENLTPN